MGDGHRQPGAGEAPPIVTSIWSSRRFKVERVPLSWALQLRRMKGYPVALRTWHIPVNEPGDVARVAVALGDLGAAFLDGGPLSPAEHIRMERAEGRLDDRPFRRVTTDGRTSQL